MAHLPKCLSLFLLWIVFSSSSIGQSSYIQLGSETYHIFDRLDVLSGSESIIHSGLRPFAQKDIQAFAFKLHQEKNDLGLRNDENLLYLLKDNNEWGKPNNSLSLGSGFKQEYIDSSQVFYTLKEEVTEDSGSNFDYTFRNDRPILRYFYQSPSKFFEFKSDHFQFSINPVINLRYGRDVEQHEGTLFQNTRGIVLRGQIDNKVYFYSDFIETQTKFNDFREQWIDRYNAIPGHGNFKSYTSSVLDDLTGWDIPKSTAYIGYKISKHIGVELGHGNHFIGHGYHSLLLSDFSDNYFYLKMSARVWKIHYQSIFAELSPVSRFDVQGDQLLPKKYMATHYFSFKPFKNMEIGLFETVMFARPDHFEFQYLNPVILYRTVEFSLGSPDNVLIGLNGKWNLFNRISLYGQLILDEFKLDELTSGAGWWANKYGIQLGLKYFDVFGVNQLDAQLEFNTARPYTYSHRDSLPGLSNRSIANYSHYNQSLAHPLGANFKEIMGMIKYRPIKNLLVTATGFYTIYGESDEQNNWGENILTPSETRVQDFGNEIGQGIETTIVNLKLDVSYQLTHNLYLDLNFMQRIQDSLVDSKDIETQYVGFGIRMNTAQLKIDY